MIRILETEQFQYLVRREALPADRQTLLLAHPPEHVDHVVGPLAQAAREAGFVHLDPDTVLSPGSALAALLAAGAVVQGVDCVLSGDVRNAFCAVRPPGHHAERARAMGFCIFNNVAIAALHALKNHGLARVAVIDFDVHHGNGTQDIFFNDGRLFYASTHQSPFYPGTGRASERGIADNILNVPLAAGSGSTQFRRAYGERILPALESFAPQLILISAGFDAHRADPLAELTLGDDDFYWVTREICRVAERVCGARVVSALEGGYDLAALARSAAAHVRALMES